MTCFWGSFKSMCPLRQQVSLLMKCIVCWLELSVKFCCITLAAKKVSKSINSLYIDVILNCKLCEVKWRIRRM